MRISVDNDELNNDVIESPVSISQNQSCAIGVTALALGVTAGVPYFAPAFKAAGRFTNLGIAFAGSTLIVYACAGTWGWHSLISEYVQNNQPVSVRAVMGSVVLAACSGTVNFFTAKKVNEAQLFPYMAFVNWYGMDAYGYYKLISFVISTRPARVERIDETEFEKTLKKLILAFPIGQLIVNANIAYQAGEKMVNNPYEALPFALLALGEFALSVVSSQEAVEGFFVDDKVEAKFSRNVAMIALLIRFISLTALVLATSSDAEIAQESMGDELVGKILAFLAIGGGFLLGTYVVRDLSNKSIMFFSTPSASPRAEATIAARAEQETDDRQFLLNH